MCATRAHSTSLDSAGAREAASRLRRRAVEQEPSVSRLIRVLDPQEKRWFDGIDGRRSAIEIVDHRGAPDRDRAHTFIERLWWYDQVVSDASDAREVDSG
jgi:hypothetical protein